MYQIICDGKPLHDSRSNEYRVIEPKCETELNKTGTLSFRIYPEHPYYDLIQKHKSEISLYENGDWIFTGRVLNDEADIYGVKTVSVEGELGYLLDSIQRSKVYHVEDKDGENKVSIYLKDVISIHNSQVESKKQFTVGKVTVKDESEQLYKISSYKDTLTTLNEDLIKTFKGYFFTRNVGNVKYLDYLDYLRLEDFPENNQTIQFGKNLLKLTKYVKGEEIATIIIPLGAKKDQSSTESETRWDISELPYSKDGSIVHEAGTDYIYDEEAIKLYGKITKVIEFDGVTEPDNLLSKAKEQLDYYKQLSLSLELSAFDLHLLDVNIQSIRVGQRIRVISPKHDLDAYMIVEKMTIDIDSPDKSKITLGTVERSAVEVSGGSISKKTNDNGNNVGVIEQDLKNSNYVTPDTFNKVIENSGYIGSPDFNQKLNDLGYLTNDNLGSAIDDYFDGQYGMGGNYDLSQYATKSEVNSAFDSLAMLIEGM